MGPTFTTTGGARELDETQPWEHHGVAVVIEAIQRGICAASSVIAWNDLLGRRGSRVVRRALEDVQAGAWSLPEAALAKLVVRSSTLPEPWPNAELKTLDRRPLTSPDLWFDDVGLAVMVHSRAYHAIGEEWEHTVAGDSDLVTQGVTVLGVTPTQLARSPEIVLDRVERAYAAVKASGRRPASSPGAATPSSRGERRPPARTPADGPSCRMRAGCAPDARRMIAGCAG